MQGVLTATAFMETLGISVTKECDLASYMNFCCYESKFDFWADLRLGDFIAPKNVKIIFMEHLIFYEVIFTVQNI